MLEGLPNPNVPLNISINNLPFINVKDLKKVLTNQDSHFIVTVD